MQLITGMYEVCRPQVAEGLAASLTPLTTCLGVKEGRWRDQPCETTAGDHWPPLILSTVVRLAS